MGHNEVNVTVVKAQTYLQSVRTDWDPAKTILYTEGEIFALVECNNLLNNYNLVMIQIHCDNLNFLLKLSLLQVNM